MTLAVLIAWIKSAITFGTVIMLGAIGEIVTEKSGNLNLGVPGVMYLGGIASLAGAFFYESACKNAGVTPMAWLCIVIALICALAAGLLGGLIYSFLTITLRANQNVTGLTLTIFGSGVANFFGGSLVKLAGGVGQISVASTSAAFRARLPFATSLGQIGEVFLDYGWMVYVAILLAVLAHLLLKKTRVGLNLRAVGESPATADAAGINVTRYKYFATCGGAAIGALGGMFYVMDYIKGTWANDGSIESLGWLAVALVIFTTWKPLNAIWGSYLFGFCYWLYAYIPKEISASLSASMGLYKSTYLQWLYKMIPYIVTLIVLIVVSLRKKRENQGPGSLGLAYFREDR